MFIRSKDGRHLTEVHTIDLEGKKLIVNGAVFGEYEDEIEALGTFALLSREIADCETFYDLSGEISPDFDDDFDEDDFDEDGDVLYFR